MEPSSLLENLPENLQSVLSDAPQKLVEVTFEYGMNAVFALLIFLLGKWLARRLVNVATRLMASQHIDTTVSGFVGKILYVVLLMLVIIATLSQLGIPTASFIAVIGAAGLAIGLALQGSLSNFASGVLLVTLKPLKVGDYVEAGSVSGTVDIVSIFSTTLITPDKRVITVPNSQVLGEPIVNYSTSADRRLDLEIGISYNADIPHAKRILQSIVDADDRVLKGERTTQIGVLALADASVTLALRPWVKNEDYWPLRFDLLETIKRRFDEEGIGIPYPQMDVHLNRIDVQG